MIGNSVTNIASLSDLRVNERRYHRAKRPYAAPEAR